MSRPALLRTADSAADPASGRVRYATEDDYHLDVWTGVSGKLAAKVYGGSGQSTAFRPRDEDDALSFGESEIAKWRRAKAA